MSPHQPIPRPVAFAHQILRAALAPGHCAIDATCGNGHDTVALAGMVGPTGHVLAIDVQEDAVRATMDQCVSMDCSGQVTVVRGDHAGLGELARAHLPVAGEVAAVVFNLGYFPGGDKSIITRAETTMRALGAATGILAPGGVVVVVCYPGHAGGEGETETVRDWCSRLPADVWLVAEYAFLNQPSRPPVVLALHRRR